MGAGHLRGLYLQRQSPLHAVAPHVKVLAAVWLVVVVASIPRQQVWAFGVAGISIVAGFIFSGLTVGQVLRRLVVLAPFVPVVIALPFIAGGEPAEVFGVAVSEEGLWGAWNFLAKAIVGVSVSSIVTASTTVPDILAALGKLRMPKILVAIASSMVRYLDLIVEETSRMRLAMVSRGYSPAWFWQAKPLATSAGSLFVRSYERSERVHAAMMARGFTGTLPQRRVVASASQWVAVCAAPAVMTVVLLVAILK